MTLKNYGLAVLLLITTLTGCNTQQKESNISEVKSGNTKVDSVQTVISCDYYLTPGEGQQMVVKYNEHFRKEGTANEETGLTKQFWIPKCMIDELDRFFKAKNSYDGIRIYWICDDSENATLHMIPTTATIPTSDFYKHTNRWDAVFNKEEYPCISGSAYFRYGRNQFELRKGIFGKKYRQERTSQGEIVADIPDLSSAVWVDSCVIAVLKKTLDKHAATVNGIMACAAAYLKKDSSSAQRGQLYDNQSTLVFVPGKENGDLKWDIIEKYGAGVANHGQLCPQICD